MVRREGEEDSSYTPYRGEGGKPAVTGLIQVKASVSKTHKSLKADSAPSQPP